MNIVEITIVQDFAQKTSRIITSAHFTGGNEVNLIARKEEEIELSIKDNSFGNEKRANNDRHLHTLGCLGVIAVWIIRTTDIIFRK